MVIYVYICIYTKQIFLTKNANLNSSMTKITILLPTRKRPQSLESSIQSLLKLAAEPQSLEILLAVDTDDSDTLNWATETKLETQAKITVVEFERLGYHQMHRYLNQLAKVGSGQQFMFWNDDAEMLTEHWDTIVSAHAHTQSLIRMQVINHEHPYALFPIINRTWYAITGAISYTCQSDRFLFEVADKLVYTNKLINIPVFTKHHRADLTGLNNDETYAERIYMEGDPSNPLHADSPEAQGAVWQASMRLNYYYAKKQGLV
jgi:glycosyltransferase involved in cell wall biosynthesis